MSSRGMDVYLSFRKYITRMLQSQGHMKVLLLDQETLRMISLVYSMAEILNKEVFQTNFLFLRKKKSYDYLDAVILIRPTEKNIFYLKQELQDPCYKSYKIYFTNACKDEYLRALAASDKHQKVESVYEFYADFCALGPQLFVTNFAEPPKRKKVDESAAMSKAPVVPASYYNPFTDLYADRSVDGIVAALLSLKAMPYIRHSANTSNRAREVARKVQSRISKMQATMGSRSEDPKTLLLIMDRNDDPVTPLLMQWTYQAMIHDLTANGVRFNRAVMVKKEPAYDKSGRAVVDSKTGKQKVKTTKDEVTMNEMTDMEFYGKNLYKKFQDVIDSYRDVAAEAKRVGKQIEDLRRTKRVDDIQELLTRLPAVKSRERTAEKHSKLLDYLMGEMDKYGLAEISKCQQEIANPALKAGARELQSSVAKVIKNSNAKPLDKLKLVMLFALRFEDNRERVRELKSMLAMHVPELTAPSVNLIDTLLDTMGQARRVGNCFTKSKIWKVLFSGVDLLQCDPMLLTVLKDVCSGNLSPAHYPFMGSRTDVVPDKIIVYYVGGTTYAESRVVHHVNNNTTEQKPLKCFRNKQVLLGGSEILRSITFLKYLKELAQSRRSF
eukprot:g3757.t1